ncbi:MAG TPA: FAD-dependent oxidoreductase [Dermatophilaceae bacterium]|nr:FAD-dependent oxidoreductase [Dermatophilaceae bacterium]HQK60914.1 FAD-dependent oxidoreductase [Dermatophilaceae bacterium]
MRTVVVIGGVAGGMSAAARLRRLDPSARIVVVEQGSEVSFANCGLPYFLSGEIANRSDLLLRTPESLAATLGLEVRVDTLATAIDPAAREVTVRGPEGREERIGYDALVLAPGAYAVRPPIPGIDHPRVRTLRTVPDADTIRGWVQQGAARAVVLGAGFIGLEAAEALRHAGLDVSIVEAAPHVLPVIDAELAAYVADELRTHGVDVHEGVAARAILDVEGTPVVELADGTVLPADLVILSVGVRPRSELAAAAGLALTEQGAIIVDDDQRTSDPHIWAVGDATASTHAITGAVAPVALATPANRSGRVAADSIAGGGRRSPRPLGTAVVRVFDLTIAMTGASRRSLGDRPFHTVRVHAGHHAGYYPGAETMHLLLHFDGEGRILGAQGVGREGVDKRIDVIATAARGGLRVDDLVDLDLSYAPPFGAAKDPVMMLGMIADNVLSGRLTQHDPVAPLDPETTLVLDVRNPGEWDRGHIEGAMLVPQPDVAASIEEIRRAAAGRPIVVHCASGFRSYLANRTLAGAGIDSANVSGGFTTLAIAQPQLVAHPQTSPASATTSGTTVSSTNAGRNANPSGSTIVTPSLAAASSISCS